MLSGIIGKKIGMSQIFNHDGQVVPVTVIDVSNLYITQVKKTDKDGYCSVQVGLLKKKFRNQSFNKFWLKKKKNYFSSIREIKTKEADLSTFELGKAITLNDIDFKENGKVKIAGKTKGHGFQGVVKRWHFSGGFASHGSMFHRRPGAIGHMRTQGEVIKGKRLPGHKGFKTLTIQGLKIARIDADKGYLFVRGAVPGKKNSLLKVSKQK